MNYRFSAGIFIEEPFFGEMANQLGGIKRRNLLTARTLTKTVVALLVGRRKQ